MISEKEFDRDAALLAGLVGGHLNYIDKVTDNKSVPANRIQIDNFINPLRGGPPPAANYMDPVNRGYISEQQVRTMAPDISVNLIDSTPASINPVLVPMVKIPQPSVPNVQGTEVAGYKELEEDIKSIKATLQHIDNTFTKISGMLGKVFNFITEREKQN